MSVLNDSNFITISNLAGTLIKIWYHDFKMVTDGNILSTIQYLHESVGLDSAIHE